MVRKAIQQVISNEGFNLPSESSKNARKSAERLLEWSSDPESSCLFGSFASELVMQLETYFGSQQSLQHRREKMWEKLFKLHSSPSFKSKWSSFLLESISTSACPIFNQYVVDRVFDGLIKQHYKLDKLEKMSVEVKLTYEEQNALRYTCGYVTRALIKKLKRSAHPLKEEMVCCLVELNEPEEDSDHGSEDWIKRIDRGGMTHVGNMTFGVFQSMELVI